MKLYSFLVLLIWAPAMALAAPKLAVGDVLLQPLDCWACTLIEEEEKSLFSHMGVVISVSPVLVAEAYGTVRMVSLTDFLAKTERSQAVQVLRLKESLRSYKGQTLLDYYLSEFDGRKYDSEFLWHNFDQSGRELLYCSELVSKLFEDVYGLPPELKRMHFDKNPELWKKFFKGKVPAGEWGTSPGDFERSDRYMKVGEL